MVGPYKNKLIADLFSSLNEINSKNTQCYIIGGLIKNAHDLTQKQLDHLDYLLCTPFTKQKGAPKKEERSRKIIIKLQRNYDIEKNIPTYAEVIDLIKQNTPEIEDESSYRAIFNDIEPYIYYIPSGKGRRKKTPEEGN